jgi:putative ABC transport system permease protein
MREPFSDRAYRALLRFFPFDFRGDFGSEMEEVFREQRTAAVRRAGLAALFNLWWETALDIVRTAPAEHFAILRQDVRHALRVMKRELGYVALSILVLGLGIGASTALFSVIHAILIRPLPYANGSGLVVVRQLTPRGGLPEMNFSVAEIEDFRNQNRTLKALAEYHSMSFMLLDPDKTERVRTGVVSADFFDIFGVKPVRGRGFMRADDQPGAPAVLLMSFEYWHKRGADPAIVGKAVRMNDREHIVIGVLPPVPQFPDENDVFMTTSSCPFRSAPAFVKNRGSRMMLAFGLLKPGVTLEEARADMARIAAGNLRDHPEVYPQDIGYTADSVFLRDQLTLRAKPMLWLLMGASLLVLLIACANVANLTLARVGRREHELIVRSAMGAARARLLRQFLTEHMLMAALAAAAGIALTWLGMHVLTDFAARLTPRAREIALDRSVLLFAVMLAMATSVVFGSICTLAPRRNLVSGLSDSAGPRRASLRSALVVCQVALSFVLLAGAGLLTRSMINLQRVDAGVVAQNRLAVSINLSWSRPLKEQRAIAEQVLDALRAQPDVLSSALASSFPFDPQAVAYGPWEYQFQLGNGHEYKVAAVRMVTPDYFETLGMPILRGRAFSDADGEKTTPVAIVSQSLAQRYWAGRDPIGETISAENGRRITIVGIAGDVKEFGPARNSPDELYLPAVQHGAPVMAALVRSTADPAAAAASIRRTIREVDPEIAVNEITTLEEARGDSIRVNRLTTDLLGLFAAIALAIAVSGVGGILALSVARRGREIAIRMAVGAQPGAVLRMIVFQGMAQVLVGLAIGLAGALFLTRALRELLFQITPTDPATFAGVSLVLVATALAACLIPARRATRIEPSAALRCE